MGQQTIGVLFGVKVPKNLVLRDDDEPGGVGRGLLDRYEKSRKPVPDFDYDGNLLGFWVAAGASGKDGCPFLATPASLDAFDQTKPYASAVKKARAKWGKFASWARLDGHSLPEAKLYLSETEVA